MEAGCSGALVRLRWSLERRGKTTTRSKVYT